MIKEFVILGAGESGVGAALLAKAKGLKVFVSDKGDIPQKYRDELICNHIDFEEGKHSNERILNAAEVVKSPGIPDSAPLVVALRNKGISVISDIEFAGRFSKAHMIGITGSNGKTTTTLWLHHILTLSGLDAVLSGNVGVSPCRELVARDPDVFVMELSSFQLDNMFKFRVNTAILTNITPDHLDRYDYKFENYIQSKFRILQNQTEEDSFIWCADDPVVQKHFERSMTPAISLPFSSDDDGAAYVDGHDLIIAADERRVRMPVEKLALKGRHNLFNALASGLAALKAGASLEAVMLGLSTFKGVEHRLEHAGIVDGVTYINDSKATNVNSAWYALESMDKPVIWIAGGTDKGNDYEELMPLVKSKVKALICMGVDNSKLISVFGEVVPQVCDTKSIDEALQQARAIAKSGDVVLLSPACASFDLFQNYEHRGRLFKEIVMQMM
ncbi:UDP-N-acetylmuramoyl-L-alanine--D-glutamate ligase [Alkaliflexus imshenetskii]|uniref:UDP-N-acetylmuramoyl-L-alanine--D-glutamate ligase n=1 Tax=Alkaliflexus imshenetskii TaxID=286730 RepID=UPI0005C50571|nr:UDP-N-acetylmuramoyl-L-alanine--D-glutamate ligase [Alkaliflexus imshenetskii]